MSCPCVILSSRTQSYQPGRNPTFRNPRILRTLKALNRQKTLAILPIQRTLPALPIDKILPALPILSRLPTLPMLKMLPLLPMQRILPRLAMLRKLPLWSRFIRFALNYNPHCAMIPDCYRFCQQLSVYCALY